MKKTFLLYFISCLLFVPKLHSQQKEFEFVNYTQENGLPSNECYFIYRDSKNFLWFATDQGVVRYNGNKMERFDLPDNVVFKIREDSKGRIWFFSHSGKLAYFFNGQIHPFKFNYILASGNHNVLIMDAYVNEKDEVIIAGKYENYTISSSGKLEVEQNISYNDVRPDSVKFVINPISGLQYFTRHQGFNMFKLDTAFVILTCPIGTIRYSIPCKMGVPRQYGCITPDNKNFFFFTHKEVIRLYPDGSFKVKEFSSNILSMQVNNQNQIWVGLLRQGLVVMDTSLNEIQGQYVLKDKSVTSINTDYEGGTWLGTLEDGVYYTKSLHVYHMGYDSNYTQSVSRLYNYHSRSLLMANEKGVFNFSKNNVHPLFTYKADKVYDLFTDSSNNIYVAGKIELKNEHVLYSIGQVFPLRDSLMKNISLINTNSEIFPVSKGHYLFAYGILMGIMNIDSTILNGINNRNIFSRYRFIGGKNKVIFRSKNGQYLAGTFNNLYTVNPETMDMQVLNGPSKSFQNGITCIRQMDNGIYCIGIRFGGIVIMRDSNVIANITANDGLLSNSIKYLMPLKDQLWAATADGISVIKFESYNPVKYSIANIGKNEGMYNVIINQLIPFQDKIMVATNKGLYAVENSVQSLKQENIPIPLYINHINTYRGDTSNISDITVPYENNRIKIAYSAVCFNSAEEVKYYYRLNNSDTSWQTNNGTELVLENLSPGEYELELKASVLNQHRFSKIIQLNITIQKPWWQNNWLRLAALLFIVSIVVLVYNRRVNQIQKREQLKTFQNARIKELEQTALRSQMNPHFIFNCLTSIQQLIISGKTTDANEHLVKFARLIRKTLEISARPYISIAEEKKYLEEYLFLEQLRIPGQFDYSIDIDPAIDINKTEIPNMMLQPIVENCIRHGIKQLVNRKGIIHVSIRKMADHILCTVSDNGSGREMSGRGPNELTEQKSYGMGIVMKRLELLAETEHGNFSFEINDLKNEAGEPQGTQVLLQLPFRIIG